MKKQAEKMKMYVALLSAIGVVFLLFVPKEAPADTLYVGPAEAHTTIQSALTAAVDADTIIVRDGTYRGAGNKNLDFQGKAATLRSENGPANCIIDCEGDGRGFYFHMGETISSVVEGFTITNGGTVGDGGGIYCSSSSPWIRDCTIINNSADNNGGGIYCINSPLAVMLFCTISGSGSSSMALVTNRGMTFSGNWKGP